MAKTFVLVGDDFPAAQTLDLLLKAGGDVAMVFSTQRTGGFGPLGALAGGNGIPIYPSDELRRPAGLELVFGRPFDWLININSTVLLPATVLEKPQAGALNMHPGRLPDYAGLHAHQWALRNGETEFASTVHFMDLQVDTGDIVCERRFPIEPKDTGLRLFMKCICEGTAAMCDVLRWIMEDRPLPRRPQDPSRRRLYRARDARDGRIDWSWPAAQVERFVRAGNYEPLSSPSYTAHLDPVGSEGESGIIEVLKAPVIPTAGADLQPGEVFEGQGGRAVMCGDGAAVALERTRVRGPQAPLSAAGLRMLMPDGTVLQGRQAPDDLVTAKHARSAR